ncbi:MAG: aspartate--tRNA ligase, partial [Planctomycetota bacterium]
ETPMLTRSTPEGARDYVVPSRVHPGAFYALPQTPQIFKQIFMVAGFDRDMQVVRCFRDESLRADRQPEFTQLDLELACVHEEDVIDVVERLVKSLVKELMGVEITEAFPRLGYREALDRFGTDRPDQRYDLELVDITDLAAEMGFRVFQSACEAGGRVRGLCLRGGARMSRKEITELEAGLQDQGAKGLAWVKRTAEGATGPLGRFLGGEGGARLFERMGAAPADLLLFVADDKPAIVDASLAQLRSLIAEREGLIEGDQLRFLWVNDFPLFEWSEEEGRPKPCHHPFTSPREEDLERLEEDPLGVRALAYDLVLNGAEIAGGSIRIHTHAIQEKVFRAIGIGQEEAQAKFQFLLEALRYGAPPHGGIAIGIDRLAMELLGVSSIREVIPFPKTQRGVCPLTGAPATVSGEQLAELHLSLEPAAEGSSGR